MGGSRAHSSAAWRPPSPAPPPFLCLCLPWCEILEPCAPWVHACTPLPRWLPALPVVSSSLLGRALSHPRALRISSWCRVAGGGMAWLTRRAGAAGQHVRPDQRLFQRLFPAWRPRARHHLLGHVARGERFLVCARSPAQPAASAPGRGRGRGCGWQRRGRQGRELGAKQHFIVAPPALRRPPDARACVRRCCGGMERQRRAPPAQRQHCQLGPQHVQQHRRRAPRWQHARQRRVPGPKCRECLAWASAF